MAREQQKRRGGLDLEHRDRRVAVVCFAFGQRLGERGILDELAAALAADAKTLVEMHQIGRRIDVHALAGRFQDRAHEGDGRALAVGTGDMDQRRQFLFRMIERGKQVLDAVERQVDALGMQRQQSRQDGVDRRRAGPRRTHAGAGRLASDCGTLAGALVNSRHSFAIVSRISWRCTTMSTMPWSRRYSAFWNPSGNFSRMVCSMKRGPAKPINAPGSAICTSPSMAYDAVTPPVVGLVSTTM